MRLALAATTSATLFLTPLAALAAGGGSSTPPTPTETTEVCEEGLIWDQATQTCIAPEESSNTDSQRLRDVRELAYQGRYLDARAVLDTIGDQQDPLVLTYWGFVTRKTGDMEGGMAYYRAALTADPDLHLARSYMGQAHVETGALDAARGQLTEIRQRGGRGTWAELSLRMAIENGRGYSY